MNNLTEIYKKVIKQINEETDGEEDTDTTIKNLEPTSSYKDIMNTLTDNSFKQFCKELNFLVTSKDKKATLLFSTFKKGWKDQFKNIKVSNKNIDIKDLHPTQNVIFAKKSLEPVLNGKWKNANGESVLVDILNKNESKNIKMGDPIIVCNVKGIDYIIDGHHRWSKVYAMNPTAAMNAYIIEESFSTADQVLKFAQGTLAAIGKPTVAEQKPGDENLYTISEQNLTKAVESWVSDDILALIMLSDLTKDQVKDRVTLGKYIWENIEIMRSDAPKGPHSREYMPQFPDKDTNPSNVVKNIKENNMEKFAVAGYDIQKNKLQVKIIEGKEEVLKFILNQSSNTSYRSASPEKKEQILKEIYSLKGFFVEYQYKMKFKIIPVK